MPLIYSVAGQHESVEPISSTVHGDKNMLQMELMLGVGDTMNLNKILFRSSFPRGIVDGAIRQTRVGRCSLTG